MASKFLQHARRTGIYWLARRLPTCQQIAPLMSESLDRPLSARERVVMKLHMLVCAFCARYLQQLLSMREALRARAMTDLEPPPTSASALSDEARERIKHALKNRS